MKVHEVLKLAQNHLWNGVDYDDDDDGAYVSQHICCALFHMRRAQEITNEEYRAAVEWLEQLGMNQHSIKQFSEFKYGRERQAVRYCWLDFAARLAREKQKESNENRHTMDATRNQGGVGRRTSQRRLQARSWSTPPW